MSEEVAAAIDRLNRHVRADRTSEDAVYFFKGLYTLHAALSGRAEVRPISVLTKCHSCGGTGQWESWYDDRKERCHTCAARPGYVTLMFVATEIDGFRWLHPYHRGLSCEILATAYPGLVAPWPYEEGVSINQPGEKLTPTEAVPLFNLIEDWIADQLCKETQPGDIWHILHRALGPHGILSRYRLRIGFDPDSCEVCGTSENLVDRRGHMPERPRLYWSQAVCGGCKGAPFGIEPPASLITPDVQRWLGRPWRKQT